MTELAFFLDGSCLCSARNRVFVTADTTGMQRCLGLRWLGILCLVFMAFMAGLHHGISRLMLVMTGCALGNAEIRVLLMRKGHIAQLAVKLNHRLIVRYRQARRDDTSRIRKRQRDNQSIQTHHISAYLI